MDFWIVLILFSCACIFLGWYYRWMNREKDISPFRIGALVGMVGVVILLILFDGKGQSFLFLILAIFLFVILLLSNVSFAQNALHGCLITLWQFLAASLIVLIVLMICMERMQQVPKNEE